MLSPTEIDRIISSIEYHYSLMIFTSLGEEALSETDKLLLQSYGVNLAEIDLRYPPYYRNFLLGRLTAILKEKDLRQLNGEDFRLFIEKGQYVPLSSREREEYEIARAKTYNHIKGLANKITGQTRDILLEQNKMDLIADELLEGVRERKSAAKIISTIGHRTEEWDRDWKRIVVTELQDIYNLGRAVEFAKRYTDEVLVWKQVYEKACRHCISLYLTHGIGSQPKVFKLKDLRLNGTNIGLKTFEWKAIVGTTHPHCRCDLMVTFKGQVWNEEKQRWDYPPVKAEDRKSTTKTKMMVGDKEFWI